MSNTIKSTIVLDLGSGETKAGLSDEEYPSCIIPSIMSQDESIYNQHVGNNTFNQPNFVYPIDHGVVKNLDQVEKILGYVFSKDLKVNPCEHPILITQPPKNPQRDKEKLAELLFETFGVPALYEEIHSVLTFYSSGRPAGLIVESGHGVTSVVPILSGYAISEAILRLDVGGGDLDQYLVKILEETGCKVRQEDARKIKENYGFVSKIRNEKQQNKEMYVLPDGSNVMLGKERYQCIDPLFDPSLVEQYDCPGIHEMIFQSIFKCGFDLRRDIANNIILSGGNTLLKGLENRLKSEIEARVPANMKVSIIADENRKYFVWKGGSILGSLSTFLKNVCVSKAEYEEYGLPIVRKKCINGL